MSWFGDTLSFLHCELHGHDWFYTGEAAYDYLRYCQSCGRREINTSGEWVKE